jgi:hypothetical protein
VIFTHSLHFSRYKNECRNMLIYVHVRYAKMQHVSLPLDRCHSPLYLFTSFIGLKEAQWSPLADSERKDSLSVNVEFVKFHLSRSRKLNFQCEQQPSKGLKSSDQSQAVIRFSSKSLTCCCWHSSKVIRKVL